jgi:hypothetical protein
MSLSSGALVGIAGCGGEEEGPEGGTAPDAGAGADSATPSAPPAPPLDPTDDGAEGLITPELASAMVGPFWMHVSLEGTALVRFQLRGAEAAQVFYGLGDGTAAPVRTRTDDIAYQWPPGELEADFPDEPGVYTMHEAEIPLAGATAPVRFRIVEPSGAVTVGRCRPLPRVDEGFRIVWVSDTMMPNSDEVAALVHAAAPTLFLHGGDIQYQTNPLDTWNGFFHRFGPAMQRSYTHACLGNHDYEQQEEYQAQYLRFFGFQNGVNSASDWHTIRMGSVLVLMLNSEELFDEADTEQMVWARAQLEAAQADATIRQIIVGFHRPYYTFGRARPRRNTRALWQPIFEAAGVGLIMTGHDHNYQHFDLGTMKFIVDGGGGAFTYDIDDTRGDVAQNFPDELPLRVKAERTFGISIMDVRADGALEFRRLNTLGEETDRFTVPPRS